MSKVTVRAKRTVALGLAGSCDEALKERNKWRQDVETVKDVNKSNRADTEAYRKEEVTFAKSLGRQQPIEPPGVFVDPTKKQGNREWFRRGLANRLVENAAHSLLDIRAHPR